MPSHKELAQLCKACYESPSSFSRVVNTSGVWAGIVHLNTPQGLCSVIACRGSTTIQDWLRDALVLMINDPQLGLVEQGFMLGLRDLCAHVMDEIKVPQPGKLYITGHSLGAAHALLLGALLASFKVTHSITVFGSPRPGGPRLKEILANTLVYAYRNGADPVCDLPLWVPDLEPYTHPRDLIQINEAPKEDDPWGPVAPHRIDYYIKALP